MYKTNKKIIKNIIRFIIVSIFISINISICQNSYATENDEIKNVTRAYFLAEITRTYSNGDCILLENYDSEGNKIYGLIDTGRKIVKKDSDGNDSTVVKEFLKQHGVAKLEFLAITHTHGDHNGDALTVLDNFEIDTIYMKEFDSAWVTDGSKQTIYEDIIERAVQKNIKVIGVSYLSLTSSEISPSRSQDFIDNTKDAKEERFESFNDENTKFKFGSSNIQIFNWEMFDETGKQYITGVTTDTTREIVSNENNNSIAFLVTQGDKKAFFSGDMNNLDEDESTGRKGDENRLKDKIGKVDLLKLGHHGYQYSNTEDYMNVLKPKYAVITNDLGGAYKDILQWLEQNKVQYLYTTSDEQCVTATITENDVHLGFGTSGIKIINNKLYYVSENEKYADYTKIDYKIEYKDENVQVNSWRELKDVIDNNKNKIEVDDTNKICTLYKIKIQLNNGGDWTADDTIQIEKTEQIELNSLENVTILRGTTLKDKPLFSVYGILSLGKENMTGTITLDGNQNNVQASSTLIQSNSGTLNLYDKVTLCNNMNKATSRTSSGTAIVYDSRGSAIYARNTIINMYGGSITGNNQDIEYTYKLPKELKNDYKFETKGGGLYITDNSQFNMYGGKISNNESQNHSIVNSNDSYSKVISSGSVNQRCLGVGIYAASSEVNLFGGEISDNRANNYAQMTLVKPSDATIQTNINALNTIIYGTAMYTVNSKIKMHEGFVIADNTAGQHLAITMEENTSINNSISSGVRGAQVYTNTSDVNIEGGEIRNGSFTYSIIGAINGSINDKCYGGGLCIYKSSKFNIENLKINNCKSNYGGGLFIDYSDGQISNCTISKNDADYGGGIEAKSSDIKISDSDISDNIANYGGGLYIVNANSCTELENSTIKGNQAKTVSGGGIYAYGFLKVSGDNTIISDNVANIHGGGIMVRGTCEVYNGKISNNKAKTKTGGGISVYDGYLHMNGGTIENNTAKTTGGGVDFSNNGKFYFNGGTIENNIATTGNEIYPENIEIPSDQLRYNVVDMGTNGADTEDDTNGIQLALDKAKEELINGTNKEVEVYIPSGTYYINKMLNIYSNTKLLLDDNATIIHSTGKSAMLISRHLDDNGNICSGSECKHGGYTQWKNITVEGGTWNFNNDGSSNLNGLVFAHGENLTVKNVTLINNAGHTLNPSCSKDVTIENITIKNQISSEPKKVNNSNEVIHLDSASTGEPSSYPLDGTPVKNVLIQNCTFDDVFCGIGSHTGYTDKDYMGDGIVIRNNTFNNIECFAINLFAHKNVEIYNNTAIGKNEKNIISTGDEAYGFVQTAYANVNIHDNSVSNFEYTLVNSGKTSKYEITCDDDRKTYKFYIVTYNANGGEGTMETEKREYKISEKLAKNKFKKEGYKFIGWTGFRNYPISQQYRCTDNNWYKQEEIEANNLTKYIYEDEESIKDESLWHHSELIMTAQWIKRTKIDVSTKPTKLNYIQNNENLDLSGGVITATYEDGSTDQINLNDENIKIKGFDNTKIGQNTITVEYEGETATFNVEIVPDTTKTININSKFYTIDNNEKVITNVDLKTTLADFKEKIENTSDYQVKHKNGNNLSDNDYITTGCKVVTNSEEYTLIVRGDLNGTGDIELNDLAQAQKINLELIDATKTKLLAADLNQNGTIDVNDLAKLQKIFLEKK